MSIIVDDAQLLRLAADPPRNAARMLDRAWKFAPLMRLLAIVLPLLAAACAVFDIETAAWGLKGLALLQAKTVDEWLIPGLNWRQDVTLFEPPLQAWCTAVMLQIFPVGSVAGLLATSVVALSLAALLIGRWVRETTSSALALTTTVVLTVNAQWLLMAVIGSSDALTVLLIALMGWSLWGHWEESQSIVSWKLLMAGLAWGGMLLAGGILAVCFLTTVTFWAVFFRCNSPLQCEAPELETITSIQSQRTEYWTLPILFVTGAACGGWWWTMMVDRYDGEFLWIWASQSIDFTELSRSAAREIWSADLFSWFQRMSFLSGCVMLGLISGFHALWNRETSPTSQLRGFMLLWALGGVALRLAPLWTQEWNHVASRHWESYLVVPLTFLSADGLLQILQRHRSTRIDQATFLLTTLCVVWSLTERWQWGLMVGALVGLALLASTPLAITLRRSSLAWNQKEIRRWIQAFAMIIVIGHALWGIDLWWQPPSQRAVFDNCRRKLRTILPPHQISLVTSDIADDPVQIEYLLRSLFPKAKWSQSVGWDPELTKTVVAESKHPSSRMLVVEWSQRELRFRADIGTGWQVLPVVEPVPFLERRFAVHLIEPVPTL